MKYLYFFSFLIIIIGCQKEKVIEQIAFPYEKNAQIIENPEDFVPITLKYEDDKPFYFVGTKKSTLRNLEDSITAFFYENQALAIKANKDFGYNILFKANNLALYKDIFDFLIVCKNLYYPKVYLQTQSLDKQNIWGIKKNFSPFDETYYNACERHQIPINHYWYISDSSIIRQTIEALDTTNDNDIEIEPPRLSEPPLPPSPPPFLIEGFYDEYLYKGWNPILIHYSTNGFNYVDGIEVDGKTFYKTFDEVLENVKMNSHRRTILFNRETNKLADVCIFISLGDNVVYTHWLKVRQMLTNSIRNKGMDELIIDSNTFEFELMKKALELR